LKRFTEKRYSERTFTETRVSASYCGGQNSMDIMTTVTNVDIVVHQRKRTSTLKRTAHMTYSVRSSE